MGYALDSAGFPVLDDGYDFPEDTNAIVTALRKFAFARAGTEAARNALAPGHLWNGLIYSETDTGIIWQRHSAGWRIVFQDWTTYSPTPTAISGGTLTAKYRRIGKTVEVVIKHVLAGANISGTVRYTLPVAVADADVHFAGTAMLRDIAPGADYLGYVRLIGADAFPAPMGAAATYVNFSSYLSATVPFTWAAGDYIEMRFSYEAA